MKEYNFLAFDIGATSGRAVLGTLKDAKFEMKEIHRFPNPMVELHGRFYWDIYHLYTSLIESLTICARQRIRLHSIGIDTWGVDLPGTLIGRLSESIARKTGIGEIPVIAVAGHDTASAVAAVPASSPNFAYLSSGTWSLMGIEVEKPIINEVSFKNNFTNEGGIEGTTRFLKNITGMWILERCREQWKRSGLDYSYDDMVRMAELSEFTSLINPDDPRFANPENMLREITAYCEETGQAVPASDADYIHCIFYSLANRYKEVLEILKSMSPHPIERLHVIGGGSRNDLLNQLTANAIGIPVLAGPSEATAIGNCLIQAKSAGLLTDCWEMRRLIATAFPPKEFYPER